MSKAIAKKSQRKMPKPQRVGDVPVTLRHLELVKQELKSDIASVRLDTSSLRLEMKAGFTKMEADVSQVKSAVFQMQALLEEQNSRNRVALDGYTVVYEKQKSTEDRLKKLEKKVFGVEQE
jgi:uncharacterized protein YqgV (UPF0045/DUF77 family)